MNESIERLIECALEQARIAVALPDGDDDEAWKLYHQHRRTLQSNASPELWDRIASMANHSEAIARCLVPGVLRYFGGIRIDETVQLLRRMLAVETDSIVIEDIGFAFVDLDRPDAALELMLPFANHESARVREAVVHAIAFTVDPNGIAALLELSADPDDEVRNWATFFLGNRESEDPYFDDPQIREALAARLDDPHAETRAEAVEGLARRRDRRALPVLRQAIEAGIAWTPYINAARMLADPVLIPALEALQANNVDGELELGEYKLSDALAACRAGYRN